MNNKTLIEVKKLASKKSLSFLEKVLKGLSKARGTSPIRNVTPKKKKTLAEKVEFIKTFLSEGVQKTLRQSAQAVKASTKKVPGYAPGGIMGKNPYATKLKLQIKSGKERAAKRKSPATLPSKGGGNLRSPALGTDIAVLNALKKLKKKPRIEIEK